MGTPQIIWIVLMSMSLGMYAIKHGEPRTDNYNFWSGLLAVVIQVWILWVGGFFG